MTRSASSSSSASLLRPTSTMRLAAFLLLVLTAAPLGFAQSSGAQDIQLRQLRNDASDGGTAQLAVQVRSTRRAPNNTFGSATVDVRYDDANVQPVTAGNILPSGVYATVLRIIDCPVGGGKCVRISVTSDGLSAMSPGVSIGSAFTTLASIDFELNATSAAGTPFEIVQPSLSVGYYDSPDDASGDGRIEDNTGAVGDEVIPFSTITDLTTRPPGFVVTNPVANDYFAWGEPINVRWTTEPGTPAGDVRIALLCQGREPYTVIASRVNDGATGFLMPAELGVHGGPADSNGGCRAEVALANDPSYAAASPSFVVQDDAAGVAITEPTRLDRYGLQGRFHWRWDPADIQGAGTVRLSLVCQGRAEFVRFPATPNDGNQGLELLPDFGAWDNCHAQVAATDDLTNYGRGMSFEILDVPLPTIELTAPLAGTTWQAGTTQAITWNTVSTDAAVNVSVFLDNFAPGASPFVTRLAITPNDGSFSWAIPPGQPAGTEYRMRLAAYAQDGSLIRDIAFPFTVTAPTAKADGLLAAIPLERGWTRVEAPTATDAVAWLAPLVETAGRVVARDDAGRILTLTAGGEGTPGQAVGDLRALAAGSVLDVWVDGDATLGAAPAQTDAPAPPRPHLALADGALQHPAALWTVTAPSLADGDEVGVYRGDALVGRGVVRSGIATAVVLGDLFQAPEAPETSQAPTAARRGALARDAEKPVRTDRSAAPAEESPADAAPLHVKAWTGGAVRTLELSRDGRVLDTAVPFAAGAAVSLTARLLDPLPEDDTADAETSGDETAGSRAEPPPTQLTLSGARPNPVRRVATLRIGLPDAGPLRVEVFDVRGRRVAVLADGAERAAGWHLMPLDASLLAPGLYLVRLAAGRAVQTQTLTVVR